MTSMTARNSLIPGKARAHRARLQFADSSVSATAKSLSFQPKNAATFVKRCKNGLLVAKKLMASKDLRESRRALSPSIPGRRQPVALHSSFGLVGDSLAGEA